MTPPPDPLTRIAELESILSRATKPDPNALQCSYMYSYREGGFYTLERDRLIQVYAASLVHVAFTPDSAQGRADAACIAALLEAAPWLLPLAKRAAAMEKAIRDIPATLADELQAKGMAYSAGKILALHHTLEAP